MRLSRFFPRRILALLLAAWLPCAAAIEEAPEPALRAVLFYNFLKFAELPANGAPEQPLSICVAARDPELLAAMRRLSERPLRGRPLVVRAYDAAADCDAIYVESRARWQAIVNGAGAPRALTVGAYAGFVDEGGIIELSFDRGRGRFDINQPAARQAGIRFSPQLLRLARRLID
ncbi:MAG: YfiR family protein [Betaproteobacteria bacterium]|nr:YfiR family protein [Betaproteobacteria bacterium]